MQEFINILVSNSDKSKVLAVKRSKSDKAFGGMWALPGGEIGEEEIQQAARREVREETGLALVWMASYDLLVCKPQLQGEQIKLRLREGQVLGGEIKPLDKKVEEADWIEPKKLLKSWEKFELPKKEMKEFKRILKQEGYKV